ncbi:DUF2322 family protein [Camelimonas abortus]|uniref:DUF2322 family protein n=1 Tax=Camelimonas abortus TaxID=1017184 RepID=A0ABV7LB41_9HYPH
MKIAPGPDFRANLQLLPPVTDVLRIELADASGAPAGVIENQPGKQGSLAVYQYLAQCFGVIDAAAAEHGLAVFGEHVADARARPGAHPNIDRLLAIAAGGAPLQVRIVRV